MSEPSITVTAASMSARPINQPKIAVADILAATASHYQVRVADLLGPRRLRAYARPRQLAMYLARRLTTRSYPDLGRRFGGRDHTTILFGCRRTEARISADPQIELAALVIERRCVERAAERKPVHVDWLVRTGGAA